MRRMVNKMHKWECELGYIVYHSISKTLDKAIEQEFIDGIEELEKAVDYYLENFIISGYKLKEKSEILKKMK